jgi:CDP-diacylglycerol--glycerol-3-phosphate 3-phosphatidyltransferase
LIYNFARMFRHVPNALTLLRLVLAAVFFVLLSNYQNESPTGPGPGRELVLLNIAFFVYLLALLTDFLDGYLARRWNVEGAFGRIVDPFVDKVLVLGSFIFFAGKNFTIPFPNPTETPQNVKTITGVVPWMVVVILARELLVTSLRGSSESGGQAFGSQFSGKLKMGLQSVTILVILLYVNYRQRLTGIETQFRIFRDFCIWATLAVTVISGLLYLRDGIVLLRRRHSEAPR